MRFFVDNESTVVSKKYYLYWLSKLDMDYLSMAYELCQDGDYQKALKYFDLVLQKTPKNINAIIDKGVTLQNLNKLGSSLKLYNKALELDPNNIDALVNKGSSLHSLGKYTEAIKCYNLALKIDKKCTMALAYKGLSLGELGQVQDALKLFKQALVLDSDYDLAQISHKKALEILKASRIMKI